MAVIEIRNWFGWPFQQKGFVNCEDISFNIWYSYIYLNIIITSYITRYMPHATYTDIYIYILIIQHVEIFWLVQRSLFVALFFLIIVQFHMLNDSNSLKRCRCWTFRKHEYPKKHENSRCHPKKGTDTLPKTNIAPENRPLEKEIPIGNHHFQGLR